MSKDSPKKDPPKRIKGIVGGKIHGELSDKSALNAINCIVQAIVKKEGIEDVEVVIKPKKK
jgi:hypothetical protein